MAKPSALKLSICIVTLNRVNFIGATLESILFQVTNECEVVVLDCASTDGTDVLMLEYTRRFDRVRYIRQEANNGIDRDYDRIVELAAGEYCWLMTDDDLLKPGVVAAVLQALRREHTLVIINAECRDFSMSKVVQRRWMDFESDRTYGPEEMDRLFVEVGDVLVYIGCVVIKRAIWLMRDRRRYYDSMFIHLGVLFQERLPGGALVIAEPFISYRMGNEHTFSAKAFEVFMISWPSVVWSLTLSDSAKRKVCSTEPWRHLWELLVWRGMGFYSLSDYRRSIHPRVHSIREKLAPALVALLPGVLVNALVLVYFSVTVRRYRVWQPHTMLQAMKDSRFFFRNWRFLKRASS